MKSELFLVTPEFDYEPDQTRLHLQDVAQAPGAPFTFVLTPPAPEPRIMVRCKECPEGQWAFRYGTIELTELLQQLENHSSAHEKKGAKLA